MRLGSLSTAFRCDVFGVLLLSSASKSPESSAIATQPSSAASHVVDGPVLLPTHLPEITQPLWGRDSHIWGCLSAAKVQIFFDATYESTRTNIPPALTTTTINHHPHSSIPSPPLCPCSRPRLRYHPPCDKLTCPRLHSPPPPPLRQPPRRCRCQGRLQCRRRGRRSRKSAAALAAAAV